MDDELSNMFKIFIQNIAGLQELILCFNPCLSYLQKFLNDGYFTHICVF